MAVTPSLQLRDLSPALLWAHFLELTTIPRPSGEEAAVREHIVAWADTHGFLTASDAAGNLVVRVPATEGREDRTTLILQSHLDMVCEREPDSQFDARRGSIEVCHEGDLVFARGTTLGADNGIGVATAVAIAEDREVRHGPLELLFTVGEEQGLSGAKALDSALVSGPILLNLDGFSGTTITIGCAGSADVLLTLQLGPKPTLDRDATLELAIEGLQGGHSGHDINKGRGNAIQALARILRAIAEQTTIRLVSFDGGVSHNAIPRDAHARISLSRDDADKVRELAFREAAITHRRDWPRYEGLGLAIEEVSPPAQTASDVKSTLEMLDLISALPSGPLAIDESSGVVETSSSLNIATTANGILGLTLMVRSANHISLDDVVATLTAAGRLAGADVQTWRAYPPWRESEDSPLVRIARGTYLRLFGEAPRIEAAHVGLECAVLSSKLPGVEMIAIGPDLFGCHAPGERVGVSSTARFYRFLDALLDDLSH